MVSLRGALGSASCEYAFEPSSRQSARSDKRPEGIASWLGQAAGNRGGEGRTWTIMANELAVDGARLGGKARRPVTKNLQVRELHIHFRTTVGRLTSGHAHRLVKD